MDEFWKFEKGALVAPGDVSNHAAALELVRKDLEAVSDAVDFCFHVALTFPVVREDPEFQNFTFWENVDYPSKEPL